MDHASLASSSPDRADLSSDEVNVSEWVPSPEWVGLTTPAGSAGSDIDADLTKIAKDVSTAAGSDIDADLTKIAKDVSGIVNYVEGTNEE